MPTTTYMSMVLPTEDGSSGTWDTLLNAAWAVVDAHDHSTGKGVTVKSAGIEINADLPCGGFALTGAKAFDMTAVAAATMSGYACALFTNSADNELYWRTSGGSNVQLTSGTSLNAALLGGITGDYGAGNEDVSYASGTGIYNFLRDTTTRGYLDVADVRFFESTSGVTNAVKLKSPASLAGSYTITFPGAAPASTHLLKMESDGDLVTTGAATHNGNLTQTGTLTVSSTTTLQSTLGVTGAATLSSTLGVTGATTLSSTLGVTGAATLSSTLGVTGLITATAGLTASANQHITVSGTGVFKHGSRTVVIPGSDFKPEFETLDFSRSSSGYVVHNGATDAEWTCGIHLPTGARVTQVDWYVKHGAGTSSRVYSTNNSALASNSRTIIESDSSAADNIAATVSNTTDFTLAATDRYYLVASLTEAGDEIRSVVITYDQP